MCVLFLCILHFSTQIKCAYIIGNNCLPLRLLYVHFVLVDASQRGGCQRNVKIPFLLFLCPVMWSCIVMWIVFISRLKTLAQIFNPWIYVMRQKWFFRWLFLKVIVKTSILTKKTENILLARVWLKFLFLWTIFLTGSSWNFPSHSFKLSWPQIIFSF